MKTKNGFEAQAKVVKVTAEPRSYIVNCGGTTYRRNRRDLLKVHEPDIGEEAIPLETPVATQPNNQPEPSGNKTRSGRLVRKPDYYNA